jgi:hypothetical protein
MSAPLEQRLAEMVKASPTVMQVLRGIEALGLPQGRLVSGAVYQTVWNALTGRDPDYGVRDFDVAYFDPDVSWEAEDAYIRAAAGYFPPGLGERVEVRNQARVHLWYPQKFGRPYAPLASTDESLDRSLATAHAVGVKLAPDGGIDVCAPYGLQDMFALVLKPAPMNNNPAVHLEKARSAKARWPEIVVLG